MLSENVSDILLYLQCRVYISYGT